jgi:hypothetical protein
VSRARQRHAGRKTSRRKTSRRKTSRRKTADRIAIRIRRRRDLIVRQTAAWRQMPAARRIGDHASGQIAAAIAAVEVAENGVEKSHGY